MTGSYIQNVRFGAVLAGNNSLFSLNQIDHSAMTASTTQRGQRAPP
jgi:hypothetical protein